MKRFLVLIFSVMIFAFGGVCLSVGNISFAQEGDKVFKISSAEEFLEVMTNEGVYDDTSVNIMLTDSFDLAETDLTPIFELNAKFRGKFDGNGYTISNINFPMSGQYVGLIPQASGAEITNVKISGNVTYGFSSSYVDELYLGVLVGYGENVTFSKCEFDNLDDENHEDIELKVYSNLNFGMLAGRLRNDIAVNSSISDCVNYFNANVILNKDANVRVGGLVGYGENLSILNVLNFGNVTLTNNLSDSPLDKVYIGGIVGAVNGSKTAIRNACFGGNITVPNASSSNIIYGGILGGAMTSLPARANTNFVYYSDFNLKPSGDDFLVLTDKVAKVSSINREFVSNKENFDPANSSFDFEKVWRQVASRSSLHLQNFQLFDFAFNSLLDNAQMIDNATFSTLDQNELNSLQVKYNQEIQIHISLKEEYYGYYILSRVLLNGNELSSEFKTEEVKNSENLVTGYVVTLLANAQTSGSYSFSVTPKAYNCVIAVSDRAKTNGEGVIRFNDGDPIIDMSYPFYNNSREQKIVAEGKSIYSFDFWELYYRDSNGNFTSRATFENYQDSGLRINFGTAPFDREFKLVANFTDQAAIEVSFGRINASVIKSISFGGVEYDGMAIKVSPNSSQSLELVVNKDYVLDVDVFVGDIGALYGGNPTSSLIVRDPESTDDNIYKLNDDGDKVYRFSINMRYIKNIEDNSLRLSFLTHEDKTGGAKSLLWLYITLPIVVVVIVGVIVFIVLRRRGGGTSYSRTSGTAKTKTKKENYKDLY